MAENVFLVVVIASMSVTEILSFSIPLQNFLSSILLEMKITLFTICINQYFPQIEAISVYCDFRRFLMRNHSILLLYQREKKIRDASVQRFE